MMGASLAREPDTAPLQAARALDPPRPARFGMSARLFLFTVAFVVLAEVLIYVPAVASFRRGWIVNRVEAARVAMVALDAAPGRQVSESLSRRLLDGAGVRSVATGEIGNSRHLSGRPGSAEIADEVDLGTRTWIDSVRGAWRTLVAPAHASIRIIAPAREGKERIEILVDEAPMRAAMLAYSFQFLLSSLIVATAAASLVFLALQRVIVRPVQRLVRNITAFAGDPERANRVLEPSRRGDEIGLAELALAQMEAALCDQLRQRRRLAELGLSVSKVNHELRNLLTTAQLLGDRLESVADPVVQRVAPRLLGALDRAAQFCEATLAYGRAAEQLPRRRRVRLAPILAELSDLARLSSDARLSVRSELAPDLTIDADPEQLARALGNLVRNAVQALDPSERGEVPPRVTITASRDGGSGVMILVSDNGPGLPERARAQPFAPFQASGRAGGAGLGLAIAAELVQLNGGVLSLEPTEAGTCFRIVIPDRMVEAEAA